MQVHTSVVSLVYARRSPCQWMLNDRLAWWPHGAQSIPERSFSQLSLEIKTYFLSNEWDNRPYALTSRLRNNDAMLGSRLVALCAHVVLEECVSALNLSQCAGPGRPGGMACRGWPAGCMLGDGARDSASFDHQHAGAPFCDVICIRSILID